MKYAITKDKTIKMPRATHKAWVEALRSGEVEQGEGQLRQHFDLDIPTAYCCLGVLQCLILKKPLLHEAQGMPLEIMLSEHDITFSEGDTFKVLDVEVDEGRPCDITRFDEGRPCDITKFNDGTAVIRQHSFKEIADIIDQLVEFTD